MTAFAWALVHFCWQGALIGAVAVILQRLAGRPTVRYAVGVCALALMLASLGGTFAVVTSRTAEEPTASVPAPRGSEATLDGGRTDLQAANSGSLHNQPALRTADTPLAPRPSYVAMALGALNRPGTSRAIVFCWLMGVVALTVRLTGAWIVTRRLATRAIQPIAAELKTRAQVMAERLALTRPVRLFESAAVSAPMIVGWIRPIVLMPAASLAGLSIAQVDALIAHELAHLRRHDPIINLLQSVTETLLFYHPAVWWVSRSVRQAREHCCDDLAIFVTGDRLTYATALADLASKTAGRQVALAASGGSLVDRIARVLGEPERRSWTPAIGASVLLSAIAFAALTPLVASTPGAPEAPPYVGRTDLQSANSGELRNLPALRTDATPTVAQIATGLTLPTIGQAPQPIGGIIEGTVSGPSGPLANVAVRLLERRVVNGRTYLLPVAAGRPVIDGSAKPGVDLEKTDREGRFSFKQVLKGTYYVLAAAEPFGLSSYPYLSFAKDLAPTGFSPTYYPAGNRASAAAPIQLAEGATIRNISIALTRVQTGTVTAQLISLPGSPNDSGLLTSIASLYASPDGEMQPAIALRGRSTSASFVFENVPAGEYVISIDPQRRLVVKPGETTHVAALANRWIKAGGRLVFNGEGPRPAMGDVWFLFEPVDDLAPTWRSGTQEHYGPLKQPYHANVSADGTFSAIVIGTANVIRLNVPVSGWALERVRLLGRDITDTPVNFTTDVEGLEVILTSRLGSAAVTVTDGSQLSPGRGIAIFAEDPVLNQFRSRYTYVDRADAEGRRAFTDLLPGRYLALALPDAPREGLQTVDPAWLESMRAKATPFTVAEGVRTNVTVPVLK